MKCLSTTLLLLLTGACLAGPAEAVTAARKDLETIPIEDRVNQLYLWDHNSEDDQKASDEFYVVLKFRLNSLSTEPEMAEAEEVAPGLWRVDLTNFALNREVLERTKDLDFYFRDRKKVVIRHRPTTKRSMKSRKMKAKGMSTMKGRMKKGMMKAKRSKGTTSSFLSSSEKEVSFPAYVWLPKRDIDFLRFHTNSESPILNAQWFLVRTGRDLNLQNREDGFGYSELLGIKDRNTYLRIIGANVKEVARLKKDVKAALEAGKGRFSSRLGASGRQIETGTSITGRFWFTLDAQFPTGKGIATTNLRRGEFNHAAEEYYGHLPNDLEVTGLFNKGGDRQASAPDFVGSNDSNLNPSRDKRIHNGRCRECHQVVIQDIGLGGIDWARWTYRKGRKGAKLGGSGVKLGSINKKVALELRRQYLGNIAKAMDDDRKVYADAIQLATTTKVTPKGLLPKELAARESKAFHEYATSEVTLKSFARELGCSTDKLYKVLKARSESLLGLETELTPLINNPPESISRLVVEDKYRTVQYYLNGEEP